MRAVRSFLVVPLVLLSAGIAVQPVYAAPSCLGATASIKGTDGADFIKGTPGNDVIAGLDGADHVAGLGGNDKICGADGDDILDGGGGSDTISGGNDDDSLTGAAGGDTLAGNAGDDQGSGGAGADEITGAAGEDTLSGNAGADDIEGQAGSDMINGGADPDDLDGGTDPGSEDGSDISFDSVYGGATTTYPTGNHCHYAESTRRCDYVDIEVLVTFDHHDVNTDLVYFTVKVRNSGSSPSVTTAHDVNVGGGGEYVSGGPASCFSANGGFGCTGFSLGLSQEFNLVVRQPFDQFGTNVTAQAYTADPEFSYDNNLSAADYNPP